MFPEIVSSITGMMCTIWKNNDYKRWFDAVSIPHSPKEDETMWKPVAAVTLGLSLMSAMFALSPALSQEAQAPPVQKSLPEQLVDTFQGLFGVHPARSNHAKGVIVEGTFTPSKKAPSLSKAAHFQKQKAPIP